MHHEIVLFHSALGLRPAVAEWAGFLRRAGHRVHTPDIFDGEIFSTVEDGLRKRDSLGIEEIVRRTRAAVNQLPAELVYIGWSLGAAGATLMAATRPGAAAAVLLHGVVALGALGAPCWPAAVPLQIHYAENDPWVPSTDVRSLASAVTAAGGRFEEFSYGALPHLFDDAELPGHSAAATATLRERVAEFLAQL